MKSPFPTGAILGVFFFPRRPLAREYVVHKSVPQLAHINLDRPKNSEKSYGNACVIVGNKGCYAPFKTPLALMFRGTPQPGANNFCDYNLLEHTAQGEIVSLNKGSNLPKTAAY